MLAKKIRIFEEYIEQYMKLLDPGETCTVTFEVVDGKGCYVIDYPNAIQFDVFSVGDEKSIEHVFN